MAAVAVSRPASKAPPVTQRLYPEAKAIGFPLNAHRFRLYSIVNALVRPTDLVLDFGAGRGRWEEGGYLGEVTNIRQRCLGLYGFDVDPIVHENDSVDITTHARVGERLPYRDGQFHVILSHAAFEHIEDPAFYARELSRVLAPGGWLVAWTPSRYGYVAMGASLVPNRLHAKVLRATGNTDREAHDVFPTCYRLNSKAALRRHFPGWQDYSFYAAGPPGYHGERLWLARIIQAANWALPGPLKPYLFVVMRKPS